MSIKNEALTADRITVVSDELIGFLINNKAMNSK